MRLLGRRAFLLDFSIRLEVFEEVRSERLEVKGGSLKLKELGYGRKRVREGGGGGGEGDKSSTAMMIMVVVVVVVA